MDSVTLTWLVNKLWVLLAAWWWYDKKKVDSRMKELEKGVHTNATDNILIAYKLESIHNLLDVKFEGLKEDMTTIKVRLDKR